MSWKLFRTEQKKKEPITIPPWSGMTLERWKGSEEHVAWASEMFRTPMFIQFLEVLHNNTPWAILGHDTQYEAQLGRIQGYREAIAVIMQLTQATQIQEEDVPVTYGGDTFDMRDEK